MSVSLGWFAPVDANTLEVTLLINGEPTQTASWRLIPSVDSDGTVLAHAVSPPDDALLLHQLRNASSLTATIDGSGLGPITFDLTGMFDTPIQENIDECGNYVEGESLQQWTNSIVVNTGPRFTA